MDFEVLGELIEVAVDDLHPDYQTAKDLAKVRAREINSNAMLLAWHSGLTGDHHPKIRCGSDPRPPWIVWAAVRGANLTVSVNGGAYVFYFLLFYEKSG
ncbi:MAG: AF1514 family protein [Desulfobacterales bacterium]|nr:AF1514 family protein [Desulfobacterales bacterium]